MDKTLLGGMQGEHNMLYYKVKEPNKKYILTDIKWVTKQMPEDHIRVYI